jgi:hypothetical protein
MVHGRLSFWDSPSLTCNLLTTYNVSLKAFHVVFITAACALAFGCAVWGFKSFFSAEGRMLDLLFGIGSLIAGIGLIFYERYFLKKLKDVSYL